MSGYESVLNHRLAAMEQASEERASPLKRRNISELYTEGVGPKLLVASKMPFQNRMASFLLGMTDKMVKDIQMHKRLSELPSISRERLERSSLLRRINCLNIFKNIKEVRQQKEAKQCEEKETKERISQLRLRQALCRDQSNNSIEDKNELRTVCESANLKQSLRCYPSTISYHDDQDIQKKSTVSPVKYLKGYLSYVVETKQFLERARIEQQVIPVDHDHNEISARNFVILRASTLETVACKRANEKIEIASLTKIMTAYLTILVALKYSVDIDSHSTRVSDKAVDIVGTSAELQAGDTLTIRQLLYGLLLPSGNDASLVLADVMGKIIQRHKKRIPEDSLPARRTYAETFIAHMNFFSRELKLDQEWRNCSGLSANPNYSTPLSIAILSAIAMRNTTFSSIVNCREYDLQIRNERFGLVRKVVWRNTNRLLESGWEGVKTGTTESAGHCLMGKRRDLLVGVFNSRTLGRRFTECSRLHQIYG